MTLAERSLQALRKVGGEGEIVPIRRATEHVVGWLRRNSARVVVLTDAPLLQRLSLPERLKNAGFEVHLDAAMATATGTGQDPLKSTARADVGITGAALAVAELGSLVVCLSSRDGGAASLLPPQHLALLEERQIVPSLEEAWPLLVSRVQEGEGGIVLITGPSRTSDLGPLLLGVHGPQRVCVFVLTQDVEEPKHGA